MGNENSVGSSTASNIVKNESISSTDSNKLELKITSTELLKDLHNAIQNGDKADAIASKYAKELQEAISEGNTTRASEMAQLLATLEIHCKISLTSQSNKSIRLKRKVKDVKLKITIETNDVNEKVSFTIAEDATIAELRKMANELTDKS